jgi:nicotinamide-nucleotide amidase
MKDVTIISTGNELINGSLQDANSSYISSRFFATNFRVKRILVIGDSLTYLVNVLKESMESSDFVIMTGGLGPTGDDNTIEALQVIAGFNTMQHKEAEEKLKNAFKKYGRDVDKRDFKMAAVPEGSVVFKNSIGLAPGFLIAHDSCRIIAMPGVPVEMSCMLDNEVVPYLTGKGFLEQGEHLVFRIIGIKETEVNSRLDSLGITAGDMEWGMTSHMGVITVSLIDRNSQLELRSVREKISDLFGNDLIGLNYTKPEEELVELLKKENSTLAVAESCTGGMISKRVTDIPGSSAVFKGGIVAYSNSMKHDILKVADETITEYGAVSEETAGEMAKGIRAVCGSNYGVSVTGIAGPEGGSEVKPVGTVCFGFALDGKIVTETRQFPGNRERVRINSSLYVIDYMRRFLLNKKAY